MMRLIANSALILGVAFAAPAWAGPYVCLSTITEPELMHRVKQDSYFVRGTPPGKNLRMEYDGCLKK